MVEEEAMVRLQELNDWNDEQFIQELGGVFESSPWVAKKAVKFRPFTSLKDLHEKMVGIVADSPQTEQLELIRSHPDLGANIKMSSQSVSEQEEAGLRDLTEEEFRSFHHLNEIYQQRFQFPFIFAVKGKRKTEIHAALRTRVANDRRAEFEKALEEVYAIASFRLIDKIEE